MRREILLKAESSDTEMIFTVKQAKEIAEKLRKCATEG